ARDPLSPAAAWSVPALFAHGLRAHAPLKAVAAGTSGLRAWIRRARARGARFLSFDCAQPGHVRAIAAASLAEGGRHFAGAADLGGALAQRLGGAARPAVKPRGLPWYILAGTVSASTFAQLDWAGQHGLFPCEPRLWRWRGAWRVARPAGRPGVVRQVFGAMAYTSLAGREDLAPWLKAQARLGKSRTRAAADALRGLVDLGCSEAGGLNRAVWFLTGGHTLAAFFDRHRLLRCRIDGELLREAPLGLAEGPGGQAWVCSKPGGFGPVDFFGRLLEAGR
ncbi:MAG TPA: hypothetical protein VNZ67_09410, partial [bacterium]|nr:hypothetical protein [bacterium]